MPIDQDRHDHDIEQLLIEQLQVEEEIKHDLDQFVKPRLTFIKIAFRAGDNNMAEGPVTLNVGQKTVASIDGFDQFGAPFTGPIPTPTWSIDNPALDSIAADATNPENEDVTSLAAGVANLSVSLTSAEGLVCKDTQAITNDAAVPVLSSVKINFSTPA